jgi:hypothetical protein
MVKHWRSRLQLSANGSTQKTEVSYLENSEGVKAVQVGLLLFPQNVRMVTVGIVTMGCNPISCQRREFNSLYAHKIYFFI